MSDPEAALQSARDTLEWSLRHRGPDSPMTLDAKGEVAQKLERLGRFDDALALRSAGRRPLAKCAGSRRSPHAGGGGVAGVRPRSTGSAHRGAAPLRAHRGGTQPPPSGADDASTCAALEWLGCTLRYLGDLHESRRFLEEAVEGYTRQGAGETEDCMKAMSHLATTLAQLELVPEACGLRRRIVDVRNRTLGADDPRTLSSLENLATTLLWLPRARRGTRDRPEPAGEAGPPAR